MLIDDFNNTLDIWSSGLHHHEYAALLIKPDKNNWSLGQLYMHILEESNWYLEQILACAGNPANASEQMKDEAKQMFSDNKFPDREIRGDQVLAEKIGQPFSIVQLQEDIKKLKFQTNALWAKGAFDNLYSKSIHPGLGYFNPLEWLQYTEMHLRHHFKQKAKIEMFLKDRF